MRKRRKKEQKKKAQKSSGDMVAFNYFFGKDTKAKDECNTPASTGLRKHKPLGVSTPCRPVTQVKK